MIKKLNYKPIAISLMSMAFLGELVIAQGEAPAPSAPSSGSGPNTAGNSNIVEFDVRRKSILNQETSVFLEDLIVDNFDSVGKIGASYVGAALLSNRDYVYLDLKGAPVSVGDRFAIYENRGPVAVPGEFNKSVGNHIRLKGFAEVTKVDQTAVIGQIYDAAMHIEIGDAVAPLTEVNFKIAPKSPNKMVRGKILSGVRDFSLISPHDFAFINKGKKDGLEVNDRLYVYRTSDNDGEIDKKRPTMNIAELVVVNVGERTATAYCMGAQDAFRKGAAFKSAISEVKFLDDKEKAALQNGESPVSDSTSEETSEFEGPRSNTFTALGLGAKMYLGGDSDKSPKFSFVFDFGGEKWSSPFQYTILDSHSQEIGWSPQWRMAFPFLENKKRFYFYLGVGPAFTVSINSSGRESIYFTQIGVQVRPEVRYFLSEQFFASVQPLAGDLYFWRYLNRGVGKGGKIDITGALSSYINIGLTF